MSSLSNSNGTISFLSWKGPVREAGESVQEYDRPGMDGQEYRREGKRGPKYQVRTRAAATSQENANDIARSYETAQSQIFTVTDAHGQTHTGHIVHNVRPSITPVGANAGLPAGTTHLVMATWTLQDTGTT